MIIDQAAADELVTVREKYNKLTEENETLNENIEKLETKCKDQDDSLEKTKETLNSQKEEIDALLKQVAELERYYLLIKYLIFWKFEQRLPYFRITFNSLILFLLQ